MGQNPAADALLDIPRKVGRLYNRLNQPMRNPMQRQDTSWHDEMVRKANDSFRDAQKREDAAMKARAAKRKTGTRAAGQRKTASRSSGR